MSDPLLDVLLEEVPAENRAVIDRHSKENSLFLDHLRMLPLGSIPNERQYLDSSHESIKKTLVSLAVTANGQFIDSAVAVSDFATKYSDFAATATEIASVHLDTSLEADIEHTEHSIRARTATDSATAEPVVLLRNIERIQDILELPSLALACVRNGYYAEALDLAAHIRRLKTRYPGIAIITQIEAEVEEVLDTMMKQLFKLLRQQVKLPALIKSISYLRRMRPFSALEPALATYQLEVLLLSSRLHYIRSQLGTIKPLRHTPEKYLKRYMEIFREDVFATIVGFSSIFLDDDRDESRASSEALIANFLRAVVKELQQTIEDVAPAISDEEVRSSLWLQLAYCSQSLGRVGGDFWPSIQANTSAIKEEEWLAALKKQQDISERLSH